MQFLVLCFLFMRVCECHATADSIALCGCVAAAVLVELWRWNSSRPATRTVQSLWRTEVWRRENVHVDTLHRRSVESISHVSLLTLSACGQGLRNGRVSVRLCVRLSVPSIDRNSSVRRVCCWAPYLGRRYRSIAGAGAQQQMRTVLHLQPP